MTRVQRQRLMLQFHRRLCTDCDHHDQCLAFRASDINNCPIYLEKQKAATEFAVMTRWSMINVPLEIRLEYHRNL